MKAYTTYGIHAVISLIETKPHSIMRVILDENRRDNRIQDIIRMCEHDDIPYTSIPRSEFTRYITHTKHQGVIALHKDHPQTDTSLESLLKQESVLLLLMDNIQDEHNLGACIRSAVGAGVDAIIMPKRGVAQVGGVVQKVSAGTVEYIPIITVANLRYTIDELKKNHVWCYGADGSKRNGSIYAQSFPQRVAIVIGSEGAGLQKLTKQKCDTLIRIPLNTRAESLNVSVATGIILFEVRRQWDYSAKE